MEGKEVGCITKQWTGLVKEMFTQADNFGVRCMLIIFIRGFVDKLKCHYPCDGKVVSNGIVIIGKS